MFNNRFKFYFLFATVFATIVSCHESPEKPGDFELLPIPQEWEVSGVSKLHPNELTNYWFDGSWDLPSVGTVLSQLTPSNDHKTAFIVCQIDENIDLPAEGYTLEISKEKINISAKDRAGLLYAFMTLEQLAEDAAEQEVALPVCRIRDWPALGYRAMHWDMKHHLEKTEYYYGLLDKMARYKINAVIAEMDDKLGYERQPSVASSDALSMAEWKKISNYAYARNIEISPLIQGLGHASFILKHPEYFELRDDPKSDWAFNPLDPRTYQVQFDLYRDALEATPHGRYLHIGGDEVHTTGRGSGKTSLELQLAWLDKVCAFAEKNGRTPIFWDDMPLKLAELYVPTYKDEFTEAQVDSIWNVNGHKLSAFLNDFPKNCVYMRWNYGAPASPGNQRAMEWYTENELQVMGATAGQTRWVLMPQDEGNIHNIKAFAEISIDKGLDGLLLTLWDDDSPHFELYQRGILAFAEYTWAGGKRKVEEIKSAYRHREFSHMLSDENNAFIDSMETPVAFWKNALLADGDPNVRNRLTGQADPSAMVISLPHPKDKGSWTRTHSERLETAKKQLEALTGAISTIKMMQQKTHRNRYALEVYEQVNKLAAFSPKALLLLKEYDMADTAESESAALEKLKALPGDFQELRKELEAVYAKTRILNKPDDYILDQDYHIHMANQSLNFDWQFIGEIAFLKKLYHELLGHPYLENADPLKK